MIFGLPGAFTPTCSAKHVPSYLENHDQLKAKGVDEIWCVSVNDAFVMGAWGREQKAGGKVRMMADGSAEFAQGLRADARPDGPRHGRPLATAMPCWSTTASSRRSIARNPASTRSAAPRRCCKSSDRERRRWPDRTPRRCSRQRTLKQQVHTTGIGLHSGERVELTIQPAAVDQRHRLPSRRPRSAGRPSPPGPIG